MITDATSAKMAMQIAVTNQKTKSIRPACLLAACGNQGIRSATAVSPALHATPIATSWTIDPLRTAGETTRPRGWSRKEARPLETPATSEVQGLEKWVRDGLNRRRVH